MIEIGDILEYVEEFKAIPLGTPDYEIIKTYWIVVDINNSGSCTLFSLERNYMIQEFTDYINDPNIYKKL